MNQTGLGRKALFSLLLRMTASIKVRLTHKNEFSIFLEDMHHSRYGESTDRKSMWVNRNRVRRNARSIEKILPTIQAQRVDVYWPAKNTTLQGNEV